MWIAEYTDTFDGAPNYSWVRRCEFDMPDDASTRAILMKARKELKLTGRRGRVIDEHGDAIYWRPDGYCTILMVFQHDFV